MRARISRGIVLVTVLWLIMLLIVMALVASRVTVVEDTIARLAERRVQAESTADGAIRIALTELAVPHPDGRRWDAPSASGSIALFDSTVAVSITREAGRIDINAAEPALLYAYFRSQGLSDTDARTWRDRIADWVDTDDEPRESGAEQFDYRRAGFNDRPANAPLDSTADVRQILGGDRLEPHMLDGLTVYTHSAGVSWADAHATVRRTLQWADEHQLDSHRWIPEPSSPDAGSGAPALRPAIGEVLRLRACIAEPPPICRVAIVRLTGGNDVPLEIYRWSTEFMSGTAATQSPLSR